MASRLKSRRFIPALAGNMIEFIPPFNGGPVHPRARGEHACFEKAVLPPFGSSPRSRGTFASAGVNDNLGRFIPVLAGNILTAFVAIFK